MIKQGKARHHPRIYEDDLSAEERARVLSTGKALTIKIIRKA